MKSLEVYVVAVIWAYVEDEDDKMRMIKCVLYDKMRMTKCR